MNRRTLLLIILLLAALSLIGLALKTPAPKPEVAIKSPTPTVTPASRNFTTLMASPSAAVLTIGEETSFIIKIDTGANQVAAAQLEMLFNPDYLKITKIEPLDFFIEPMTLFKEIDVKNGTISYALGVTQARTGQGELAKITVTAKKITGSSSTPLTFLPKTSVGEIGNPASVLKEALGINFIIK